MSLNYDSGDCRVEHVGGQQQGMERVRQLLRHAPSRLLPETSASHQETEAGESPALPGLEGADGAFGNLRDG